MFKLGDNLGYKVERILSHRSFPDFKAKQKLAWDKTREAIDNNLPVFGWELDIPEYYCLNGYDEAGYFYWDYVNNKNGHKPWQELGETDIGCIKNVIVKLGAFATPEKTVKDAVAFVLKHASNPPEWIFGKYKSGLEGFDTWIAALTSGKAHSLGMAYNSQVWLECREFAVAFLKEAKNKIKHSDKIFDDCIKTYEKIVQNLKIVADLFPFFGLNPEHIKDAARISKAVEALKKTRTFEAQALQLLASLAESL